RPRGPARVLLVARGGAERDPERRLRRQGLRRAQLREDARCMCRGSTRLRGRAPDVQLVPDREARGGTLVLGGGFAGSYVARLLGKRGATIVSLENFMLYTPMLPEAASGTLEPRHVVVPLRLMCPHADLVLGRAVAHDPERQRVQVETDEAVVNVTYRNLVVALGAIPRTFPIPGLAEHAMGFKDLADAIA